MFTRLKHMLRKEFIQLLRDPRMRMVVFLAPVLQLFVFSYAITTDVRNISTVVVDRDMSVHSREVVSRFESSGYFRIVKHTGDDRAVANLLDTGQARCAVRINHGFAELIESGGTAPLQIIVDGTDSNTSGVVMNYASTILSGYSQELLRERGARDGASPPAQLVLETRNWYNPNLDSRKYFIPGLFVTILTIISVMLTAMAIVREKEIGTIEQVMVTPIRPIEFILGKTIPFAVVGLLVVTIMLVLAVTVFGVPLRGSLFVFYGGCILYLFSTLSIGLLISSVSETQQQAMLTTFLFLMPATLLSGFMFPISNMPMAVQWGTFLNPMRYILTVIRGVLMKGTGLEVLWPDFAAMFILGVVFMLIASSRFKKTLA